MLPDRPVDGTPAGIPSRIPPGTAAIITICVFVSAIQELHPEWVGMAERDPVAIAAGQWWRVITALFAFDGGAVQKLGTVFAVLALGIIAERRIGTVEWLVIAFLSGLAGQLAGLWWQPYGATASVAVAGLLGATGVWLAWPRIGAEGAIAVKVPRRLARLGVGATTLLWLARIGAVLILALTVWLLATRDMHGPAIVAGAGLCALFLFLRRSG